ncbi:sialate O-acetylesterase [Daejeonella sp.]|uniref:sialate O-acetylesterase n=1 Tax=Daejeonella sp. TaxID=2805397 RepID=UPI0027331F3E|nr:sialate O-acetylesterase [Daejeonella sp.]
MTKRIQLLVLICFTSLSLLANIRLPNIIGSHMVLQQKSSVKLWGWAAPGEKITIKTSWDNTAYQTQASNDAKWLTEIKTPEAGGPYSITLQGNNTIELEDVLIGEVWVCGGQSNMEWSGTQKLPQSLEEAPNARNNKIRLFYVSKSTSAFPQDNLDGKWVVCSPEEMIKFSAIGYFFGKNLNEKMNIPVGLINSNWGGTPAETWTPEYVVNNNNIIKKGAAELKSQPGWPHQTALAYNAMIFPLTNYSIAGAIWYQGESNVRTYYAYEKLFTGMIDAWRQQWNKNFPFFYVQIAPYTYGFKNVGALLRETQTRAAKHPNTGMVVITDLIPDTTNIHPTPKKEVAKRLSDMALNKTYAYSDISCESPVYSSHIVDKDKIIVQFANASNGLLSKGDQITSFEIAAEDKIFVPAQARIEGSSIIVYNKNIKHPAAVRFAFNNTAIPNLFNKEGLPVNLFRTDDWEMDTSAIKK